MFNMKILFQILPILFALNCEAASVFELSGKMISFGRHSKTTDYYIELERSNKIRYRVVLSEEDFNSLRTREKMNESVFISAVGENIYSNYGKGYKFFNIVSRKSY